MISDSLLLPGRGEPFSSGFALSLRSSPDRVKARKKMRLPRMIPVTIDILTGHEILLKATELARLLWNDLYTLLQERDLEGKKWFQTWYEVRDTLRPTWRGRLSNECFSHTVHEFDNAVRSWLRVRRTNPKANPPGWASLPKSLTSTIPQNAKAIGPWTFRLTLLGRGYQDRHMIVRVKLRPGIKMRQVKLIQVRPDGTGTLTYYVSAIAQASGENMAGINLGICNLAAVAFLSGESTLYSGRALLDLSRYYASRIAKCGPSIKQTGQTDTKLSPRSLAYRTKLGHIRHLAIHNLTSSIITECLERQVGTVVLGRLKYIRSRGGYNQNMRQKLKTWSFDQMTRQIIYKAKAVGIKVILVSEAYTSQTCHQCGQRGQRVKRGLFRCSCGLTINADINGAFNILKKISPIQIIAGVRLKSAENLSISIRDESSERLSKLLGPTHLVRFEIGSYMTLMRRCY